MDPTHPVTVAARELVRCAHAEPSELRTGIEWCSQCGALRYGDAHNPAAPPGGDWFRPSAALALGSALGPAALSREAQSCYAYVEAHARRMTLAELAASFGVASVFELVQAELLTLDAADHVSTSPPPVELVLGLDGLDDELAAVGAAAISLGGSVALRVVRR
jgi:hypothetical protein